MTGVQTCALPILGGAASSADGLHLNAAGFSVPGVGDVGPYPRTYLRNPSFLNHDLSLFKNIPLGESRTRKLQFRLEMFNFLNSTQFATINSVTQVATAGGQTGAAIFDNFTNLRITNNVRPAGSKAPLGQFFGEYNSARDPRIIQLALKFYW